MKGSSSNHPSLGDMLVSERIFSGFHVGFWWCNYPCPGRVRGKDYTPSNHLSNKKGALVGWVIQGMIYNPVILLGDL